MFTHYRLSRPCPAAAPGLSGVSACRQSSIVHARYILCDLLVGAEFFSCESLVDRMIIHSLTSYMHISRNIFSHTGSQQLPSQLSAEQV